MTDNKVAPLGQFDTKDKTLDEMTDKELDEYIINTRELEGYIKVTKVIAAIKRAKQAGRDEEQAKTKEQELLFKGALEGAKILHEKIAAFEKELADAKQWETEMDDMELQIIELKKENVRLRDSLENIKSACESEMKISKPLADAGNNVARTAYLLMFGVCVKAKKALEAGK